MAAPKKIKKQDLTESNKMLTPNYINEMELEILEDVNTSKGPFKKGEFITLNIGEANYLIAHGLAKAAT